MSEQTQFTIEQFSKHIGQGKMIGGKCRKCGKIHFPPRPLCDECFSEKFDWIEISPKGKLLTYTIIHVAAQPFQPMVPYAVGIVEFEHGLKIPGIIKDVAPENIKIEMPVTIAFDACTATGQWPQWSRYYFKKI